MNANKEHFGQWKKRSRFIKLSDEYSMQFLNILSFRHQVLDSVMNSSSQIEGSFQPNCTMQAALDTLPTMKRIVFHGCAFTSVLFATEKHFDEFCFYPNCRLYTLNTFRNVRKLTIRLGQYDRVDLACLVNVEELELSKFSVVNYHLLPNLKKAYFSRCFDIHDLSCFCNLSSLSLEEMHFIVDVSPLKDVPVLNFTSCDGISDVSSLGKVHDLTIEKCGKVSDLSSLGTVHSLTIRHCKSVVDITALGSVHSLTVPFFSGTDISPLQNVVVLKLTHGRSIPDVKCLENSAVRELDISDCSQISDITMLKHVIKLDISGCWNIRNFSGLIALRELIARLTEEPLRIRSAGIETFSQLHSLTLGEVRSKYVKKFFAQLAIAPLKFLKLEHWFPSETDDMSKYLTELRFLQTLEVCGCGGEKMAIPGIPSLGRLLLSHCSFSQLFIEQPVTTAESHPIYPIYYLKVVECDGKEIIISRPISFMEMENGNSCPQVTGEEYVKEIKGKVDMKDREAVYKMRQKFRNKIKI
jgi:hypothetical protein